MRYDVVAVGAGFSGMYLVYRCRQLGLTCKVLEQGSDVGGTWYWNRYPGARCDVPTVEYSYSFDAELQQQWDWQELMSTQGELLAYANHVADRHRLRQDMQFDTRVVAARFDQAQGGWSVDCESGERFECRHLVLATGCLSVPNWPDIPGRDDFTGRVYHTGLWPHEPVDFSGARVGMIGTGSSGVQSAPDIARQAAHLHVFQRTPVYTFPAANHALDDAFRERIKRDYPALRAAQRESFAGMVRYGVMGELQTLSDERIVDLPPAERRRRMREGSVASLRRYADVAVDADANEIACELYREYVASVVADDATARGLMPRGPSAASARWWISTITRRSTGPTSRWSTCATIRSNASRPAAFAPARTHSNSTRWCTPPVSMP